MKSKDQLVDYVNQLKELTKDISGFELSISMFLDTCNYGTFEENKRWILDELNKIQREIIEDNNAAKIMEIQEKIENL